MGSIRRLLESLSLSTIQQELSQVQECCYKMYSQTQKKQDIEPLEQMYHGICKQPVSSCALSAITQAWPHILNLERQEADQSIHLRYDRYGLMLTNYFAWWWLDCFLVGQVKCVLEKAYTSSEDWIVKLVKKIRHNRFTRITSYTFDPVNFHNKIIGQAFKYQTPSSTLPWDSGPDQEYKAIASSVVKIVQHWLGYPLEGAYRQKAWFVNAIIQEFGQRILLLDQTWNTYNTIKPSTFSPPHSNLQGFDAIRPLREAAKRHPLHIPDSEENKVLDRITESVLAVCNVNLPINGRVSASHSLTVAVDSVIDKRLAIFASFVRDAVSAVLQPNSTQNVSPARKAMMDDPDRFLPFREHAPSRIRFKTEDGPFHESIVCTRFGLFSALIWRGITFTARFSLEQKMVFHDFQEFQDEIFKARCSHPESDYICNPKAYGVYNKFRSPKLAEDYWKATGIYDWTSYVQGNPTSFTDCYHQFFKPGKTPVRFPQVISLTQPRIY
jgi:hypothetical protein